MRWVCTNCQKEYADAPGDVCTTCGNAAVVPADAEQERVHPFETVRSVLNGESPDSGLRPSSLIISLAFRVVVLATLVVALVVGVALLF